MNEIVVVVFDDWEGLYLNGKKVTEHHRVLDKAGFLAQHQPFTYRRDEGDDSWLNWWSDYLPEDLDRVKVLRRGKVYRPMKPLKEEHDGEEERP